MPYAPRPEQIYAVLCIHTQDGGIRLLIKALLAQMRGLQ
jgi:hypothetical protein